MDLLSAQTASTDYLSLLTIQLQNQDPIDPVDQEGLINDLTQFSILEGIQNLNASFDEVLKLTELTQGLDLVGKSVQYLDPQTGEASSGEVEFVETSDNEIRIGVNGQTVGVANITSVSSTN